MKLILALLICTLSLNVSKLIEKTSWGCTKNEYFTWENWGPGESDDSSKIIDWSENTHDKFVLNFNLKTLDYTYFSIFCMLKWHYSWSLYKSCSCFSTKIGNTEVRKRNSHKITEWFMLKGTSGDHLGQPLCSKPTSADIQGKLCFEHLLGWRICNCSGKLFQRLVKHSERPVG